MAKVQLTSQIELDFDDILAGISKLEPLELERFVEKLLALRARQNVVSLTHTETELLKKINRGLPADMRQQYDELHQKLLDRTLTASEQETLVSLSDKIEQQDAERLGYLLELAQLRGETIENLMAQLGIKASNYA